MCRPQWMQVAFWEVTNKLHYQSKFNQNGLLKFKNLTFNHGVLIKIISVKFPARAECKHTSSFQVVSKIRPGFPRFHHVRDKKYVGKGLHFRAIKVSHFPLRQSCTGYKNSLTWQTWEYQGLRTRRLTPHLCLCIKYEVTARRQLP